MINPVPMEKHWDVIVCVEGKAEQRSAGAQPPPPQAAESRRSLLTSGGAGRGCAPSGWSAPHPEKEKSPGHMTGGEGRAKINR